MNWTNAIIEYKNFLSLEKNLADNSIDAYMQDLSKFQQFALENYPETAPHDFGYEALSEFVSHIAESGVSPRTQARIISGIKSFFRFFLLTDIIDSDPTHLIESPKIGHKLPEVLNIEDIEKILAAVDLSKPEGHRNKAIIETIYGCGLRVSELTGLRISDMFLEHGFIRLRGKGSKERVVPIGSKAIMAIRIYMREIRNHMDPKGENRDILFLNRRGEQLTRVMIFTIIRQLAAVAGIKQTISPHTLRHSYATHLTKGGADLRVVQELLGHESILTTEIYTHMDREHLRQVINTCHPRA